jgi:energy-coupling factor transport system ATP-binding protein
MTAVLTIKSASVTYLVGTPFVAKALDDISLSIDHGEIVGLIGSTGSGKSTLLQAISALVDLSSGEVLYPEGYDKKKLFKNIGLVFQQPEDQLFERTVFEDVAFGPIQLGFSGEELNGRVKRALEVLGLSLEQYGQCNPLELSGGEKRRVAIAGILSMEPDFLILDEPTAGLDQNGRDLLLEAIKSLHSKLNITILVVSHDLDMLALLSGRLVVLHKGKIVADGPSLEVLSDSALLTAAGLRPPDTIDIQNRLARYGIDTGAALLNPNVLAETIVKALKKKK